MMGVARSEIIARVNRTLQDEFEIAVDKIAPDKRLREDLDLDSLDAVDMIAALEQGLHIRIDEERAKKIRTVGDVYDFVEGMLAEADAAPH
ncbi:MAG: acyl carrier protein [Deltaproteobacteria bacterium]|nr:acyl carrier protein [Deltaproteobacteria bacterium]